MPRALNRPLAAALGLAATATVVAGIAASGPATAAALPPAPSATASTTASTTASATVALGDSYASGESVSPYLPGSDTTTNRCHRSTRAYSLLPAGPTDDVDLAACSGAVTRDLYAPNHSGNRSATVDAAEPAQLSHLGPATRHVTVTIGGNDVGFSQVMGACLYTDQQRATRTDCSTGPVRALVEARIAALAGVANGATTPSGLPITPLATIVRDIATRAPSADIVLTTYPYLASSGFAGSECRVGALDVVEAPGRQVPLYLSRADTAWMMSAVNSLDTAIRTAPYRAAVPARVAEARNTFRGHGRCDASTPWITPVTGTVSTATGAVDVSAAAFHPTAEGQRAFADAVATAR